MLTFSIVLLHGAPSANSLELFLTILGPLCVLYLILYVLRARKKNDPENVLPFSSTGSPDERSGPEQRRQDSAPEDGFRLAA